jgi:putative restriction endonuclease
MWRWAAKAALSLCAATGENRSVNRDEDLRASCFARLALLQAQYGEELSYRGILDVGFPFRGRRVPFLNFQKGIYRAAAQSGPAALSIQTSWKSPYADEETDDGFHYDYRAGSPDQPDNRALRAAAELGVPIVYFVATRPGLYRPQYRTTSGMTSQANDAFSSSPASSSVTSMSPSRSQSRIR